MTRPKNLTTDTKIQITKFREEISELYHRKNKRDPQRFTDAEMDRIATLSAKINTLQGGHDGR